MTMCFRTLALAYLCLHTAVVTALADQQWRTASQLSTPLPRPGGDLLLLRNGKRLTGSLAGCGGTACRFNSSTVERARIEWIGLAGSVLPPPQLDDPAADTVFLAGGEVKKESLVGVNTREVATDGGSYPRSDVRWIYIGLSGSQGNDQPANPTPIVAATPPGDSQMSGGTAPTPGAPTPAPTAPPRSTPGVTPTPGPPHPTPSPPARSPTPPGNAKFELGGLWSGFVRGRWWGDKPEAHTELKFRAQVRLREYRYPLYGITPDTAGRRIGAMIRLEHEGTSVASDFRQTGKWGGCEGEGTTRLAYALNERGVGHASVLYLKTADVDFTKRLGFDVPRHGGLYVVDFPTPNDDRFTAQCHANGRDFTQMEPFTMPLIGRSPVGPHMSPFEDPQLRSLSDGDGRMVGHFTAPAVGAFDHLEIEWSICREGVQCSDGGAPAGAGDECPQTTEADSRVETNRAQYEEYAKEIGAKWAKYQQQMEEARRHLHDFQVTMRVCNVQNWIGNVLIALLAPEGEAAEALQAALKEDPLATLTPAEEDALIRGGLKQVADMINKIEHGENPFATMLPENVQTAMELLGVAGKLAAAMQGTTADKLGEALEECAGTAGITQGQYSSAEEYVSGLKAAVDQLAEVQTLVNTVKQLDNQLPDLQYRAYAACVERARCQGKPDSACEGLKPAGDWPPVP